MARLLLIETATEVCSVALSVDGAVVAQEEELLSGSAASRLTLFIDACLRRAKCALAELDAVAVSRGPGSYTSLRVGTATAKGICYALDKPLIAVPTLQALAWGARQNTPTTAGTPLRWVPMLDARRQEVWMAAFDEKLLPLCPDQPLILDEYLLENFNRIDPSATDTIWICAGNGTRKIPPHLLNKDQIVKSPVTACSAAFLAYWAERRFHERLFEDIAYFEPLYMKQPNITQPKKILPTDF